jgi:hypothetical protein
MIFVAKIRVNNTAAAGEGMLSGARRRRELGSPESPAAGDARGQVCISLCCFSMSHIPIYF